MVLPSSVQRIWTILLLVLYYFGVHAILLSQEGIPGTLRIQNETRTSTHAMGVVELKLNETPWLRFCIHGEVSAENLGLICTKLGYNSAGSGIVDWG